MRLKLKVGHVTLGNYSGDCQKFALLEPATAEAKKKVGHRPVFFLVIFKRGHHHPNLACLLYFLVFLLHQNQKLCNLP